jgi:hypothetical protein
VVGLSGVIGPAKQDGGDPRVAEFPDCAVQQEMVDADGGDENEFEAAIGDASGQQGGEQQHRDAVDCGSHQHGLGDELGCLRAGPFALHVIGGDPQVLDPVHDGDPEEGERGRTRRERTQALGLDEEAGDDRRGEPECLREEQHGAREDLPE